jgi:23S rRNA pseudouridine1911/1915/1917 synthase
MPEETGLRLDGFLVRRMSVSSVAAARRMLAAGVVRVNGRRAPKGIHLVPGDRVNLEAESCVEVKPEPTPGLALPILYEDDFLVAVNKPAQIPTHPLRPSDGPTVAGALIARFPECSQASPDAREGGFVHRLDVGTSGVLVAARSREAWHRLREALSDPGCEKIYRAEFEGKFPDQAASEFILPGPVPRCFVVTCPIGRQGRRGQKVRLNGGRHPLPSRTEIQLLTTRTLGGLVEARLSKGRAHQVRIHLAALGIPVWGDAIYGVPREGLRLHAHQVIFVHPYTTQVLKVMAPLPEWAVHGDDGHSNCAKLLSTNK